MNRTWGRTMESGRAVCAVVLTAIAVLCVCGCPSRAPEPKTKTPGKQGAVVNARTAPPLVRKTWTAMSTFASVSVPENDKLLLDQYVLPVRKTFEVLEEQLSVFSPFSEISAMNQTAGSLPVPVSPETADLLELAVAYARISGGAFDPTVESLIRLWGFNAGRQPGGAPNKRSLDSAMALVGYDGIAVSNGAAFLQWKGMAINLGGIAKGYAVDLAYGELFEAGAENVMVDLGGNIRCQGSPRPGEAWQIGVRHPFRRDALAGTISLGSGMAVATSGNYERFIVIDGKRYSHIIDPRTGLPASGLASVTVISSSATEADAISTALFVLGIEQARDVLETLPSCHAILIPDRKPVTLYVTRGIEKVFTPVKELADRVRPLP